MNIPMNTVASEYEVQKFRVAEFNIVGEMVYVTMESATEFTVWVEIDEDEFQAFEKHTSMSKAVQSVVAGLEEVNL